jgi:hypothetical protein
LKYLNKILKESACCAAGEGEGASAPHSDSPYDSTSLLKTLATPLVLPTGMKKKKTDLLTTLHGASQDWYSLGPQRFYMQLAFVKSNVSRCNSANNTFLSTDVI